MITSELTLHVYSKMLIVRKILNNAHCHVTDQLHVDTMETASSYSSENNDEEEDDDGEPVPRRLCQSSLCAFFSEL